MRSTLKGKNLLPHFRRAVSSREANRKWQKLFPFVEVAGKHGGLTIHFKCFYVALLPCFVALMKAHVQSIPAYDLNAGHYMKT